jgi:MFS family permease
MIPAAPAAAALRPLLWSVYAPTLLFAVGQGAVTPIVALAARELGASVAFAGLAVALRGLGILCFDLPAGWLVSRFGERRAMAAGTLLVLVSLLGSAWSRSPLLFALFTALMGCGWSVWLLARLSYVSDVMPAALRGRALSTLGGVNRIGNLLGPFLGAGAAGWLGLDGAYYIHALCALAACGLLLCCAAEGERSGAADHGHPDGQLRSIAREHAGVFLSAGLPVAALNALRGARQSAVPLWAEHIGLDPTSTSILYGLSISIETALFYPAGSAMDRFGRRPVALPCLALMSLGMLWIPFTDGFGSLLAAALLMGFGNGLGAGLVMTLGADFSPAVGRARFLGAWRLCSDLGVAGGPLLFSAATAATSLGAGSLLLAGVGALGTALMLLRMPETLRPGPSATGPLR